MKKKFKYASLVLMLVVFMGQSVLAESTIPRGLDDDIMTPSLKDRVLEMRQKIDERIKERSEKIKGAPEEARKIDIVCAQTAIDARDTAIISAFDAYSTAIKTALEARKIAVKDAWSKTTPSERNSARRTANQTYNTASRAAHKALNTSRKSIWNTHKTDMKKCGAGAGIDQMGEISGGLSL